MAEHQLKFKNPKESLALNIYFSVLDEKFRIKATISSM